MAKIMGLAKRKNVFYYRVRIPKDLKQFFGKA